MLRKGSKSFYEWCIENNKQRYLDLWDYERNEITPDNVSYTTKNKYYFKCEKGIHDSFLKGINNLLHSKDLVCPECNSFYQWCVENNRNDLIECWNNEKNIEIGINIKTISKGSGKKAWFTFKHCSYQMPITDIINPEKGSDPIRRYKNSVGYYIIEKYGDEGLKLFWSNKNKESPFSYDRGSEKYIWIKCDKKHYHEDYKIRCYSFTNSNNPIRCPMCASKKIHPLDSFAQYNINRYGEDWLEKCWMNDNTVDPYKISINNNHVKVHVRCLDVEYHDYWITPYNYDKNDHVCHLCNIKGTGGLVHKNDSVGAKYPQLINLWSDLNDKTPFDYSCNSHKYIYIKCENGLHEDYKKKVCDYVRRPMCGCPVCSKYISSYENEVRKFLKEININTLFEYNCNIIPINPKTNYYLPFDNELIDYKLIIEVMGKQHYELTGFHTLSAKHNGTTPGEEFEYTKWKDAYKKQFALNNGYRYLELPYTMFNDKQEFKKAIISEITKINSASVETTGILK